VELAPFPVKIETKVKGSGQECLHTIEIPLVRGKRGTESPQNFLFPLPAFTKKKGIGTEPTPFIALWLR
jgi:hypothetical protein